MLIIKQNMILRRIICNRKFGRVYFSKAIRSKPLKRSVLLSTSKSIFDNLALEDWMYLKTDFSETDILFMWRNRPAIVFGRHQNLWLEANVPFATAEGIDIARRSSGGGTVYHDEGNINLSFLKARSRYNRKENLDLVVDALTSQWDIDLMVNDRDDIMLERFYKISGTAAKLGRSESYHHFTLLLNVNQDKLRKSLNSPMIGVDSKSTKSFPASVMNLKDKANDMTFESVVEVIGRHFLKENEQEVNPQNFKVINPTSESEFPGVTNNLQQLKTWDWMYGKTPKFSIHRIFSGFVFQNRSCDLDVDIVVEKGIITSIVLKTDNEHLANLITMINNFYSQNLANVKLTKENLTQIKEKSVLLIKSSLQNEIAEVRSAACWVFDSVDSCFDFL